MKKAATRMESGAAGSADEREISQTLVSTSPLASQPDLPELRQIWWRFVRQGHRLPTEKHVIVVEGGR